MALSGKAKLAFSVAAIAVIAFLYLGLSEAGLWGRVFSGEGARQFIENLGPWGPVSVVALMAIAIVVSPLPSAPIAVAAGALYGHTFGTLYVIAGSEIGALVAFLLARGTGIDVVRGLIGRQEPLVHTRSQNALTFLVLVSRLAPFISFDVVSYAAGLTPLKAWRFALATLAGIAPASFFLAHVGTGLAVYEETKIATALVLLGLGGLITFWLRRLWHKRSRRVSGAVQPAGSRR